jgi:zinc and cadmium transporter
MNILYSSVLATLLVSFIAFAGIMFIAIKQATLQKILLLLVGFSAGAMLGGAMLHLLPEAAEEMKVMNIGLIIICGFAFFFILERILHWHHCHKTGGECDVHMFAYTNLIGDGLHNFLDGVVIAAAFASGWEVGIATTFAVIIHELPQEISDFGVLLYAGFSKIKALSYNFISALLAVGGAVIGSLIFKQIENIVPFLLALAAGGFIYISASDLIPELHKEKKIGKAFLSFFAFLLGVALMLVFKIIFE